LPFWPTRLKILITWPFNKKLTKPCCGVIQTTYVIINFLAATLEEVKEAGDINYFIFF
jgi:hypothetical protein